MVHADSVYVTFKILPVISLISIFDFSVNFLLSETSPESFKLRKVSHRDFVVKVIANEYFPAREVSATKSKSVKFAPHASSERD